MPIPVELPPTFTRALDDAPLIGAWICSGSQVAAEIVASAGFDWLLIDGEHSPYSLETIAELLRATDVYGPTRMVRVPVNDTALIKQYLDVGAQNLMVPMVDTAAEAEKAVAASITHRAVCAASAVRWLVLPAGMVWRGICRRPLRPSV